MLTFPTANKPLSKNNTTPSIKKPTPKLVSPMPISEKKMEKINYNPMGPPEYELDPSRSQTDVVCIFTYSGSPRGPTC